MNLTDGNMISEHDKKILAKIQMIDEESSWREWPKIASLASELESEEEKQFWHRRCVHYNHLEEASIGEL